MTPPLGLIEGFFGRPWDWAARAANVRFLAPHGYGFYLYAPKADPFLRRRWQEPHPDSEMAQLAAFRAVCRAACPVGSSEGCLVESSAVSSVGCPAEREPPCCRSARA